MKFYDREEERELLNRNWQRTESGSMITVMIGSYWDRKGENEIDIIALNDIDRTAMVMEVKRKATKYNAGELERKASVIAGELSKYKVSFAGLSMDDM